MSTFPVKVPAAIEMKFYCIRFMGSIFKNMSDYNGDGTFHSLRSNCISILLKTISSNREDLRNEAQRALMSIMSMNDSSTSDMKNPIDSILLHIEDIKNVKMTGLKAIESILLVTSDVPNSLQIGEKILQNLRFWTTPDIVMNMNVWKKGEEQEIAACMINILNHLPLTQHCNEDQFLQFFSNFVEIMVNLESVRHQFINQTSVYSHYLPPFARFLSKYPNYGTRVIFVDHDIKRYGILTLLLNVIKLKEDIFGFIQYLASQEGCQYIAKNLLTPFIASHNHGDNDEFQTKRMKLSSDNDTAAASDDSLMDIATQAESIMSNQNITYSSKGRLSMIHLMQIV